MTPKKILKELELLNREQKLALYEVLQQQLFEKNAIYEATLLPENKGVVISEEQKDELIQKINQYLGRKPVVRAYLFGEFTYWEKEQRTSLDLMVDLEKGVSYFELLDIKEGLERTLKHSIELVTGRVALLRILPT